MRCTLASARAGELPRPNQWKHLTNVSLDVLTSSWTFSAFCIRRSSSEAVVLFLHGQTFFFFFPGIFLPPPVFAHLAELRKFVLGHVCLSAPGGPRGDPEAPRTASASTCVWRFPKWPRVWRRATLAGLPLSDLAPLWLQGGGGEAVGRGTCWQGRAMFSEAQTSGSIAQYDGEKCLLLMKASSVSAFGPEPRKALCN